MNVINEMPPVAGCDATHCGYNIELKCHAKAITIGDYLTPGCDTFLDGNRHCKEVARTAGVGACKIAICKFNEDFECTAGQVTVGQADQRIKCLTFVER